MIDQVSKALEDRRKQRDAGEEQAFALLYGAETARRWEEGRRHGP